MEPTLATKTAPVAVHAHHHESRAFQVNTNHAQYPPLNPTTQCLFFQLKPNRAASPMALKRLVTDTANPETTPSNRWHSNITPNSNKHPLRDSYNDAMIYAFPKWKTITDSDETVAPNANFARRATLA